MILTLFLYSNVFAERIVVLSPAAADIVQKLGMKDDVVGVTNRVEGFEKAVKVGSHIRPNIEIIKSLKPSIVIYSSNRFFSEKMAEFTGGDMFKYAPKTLNQIMERIYAFSVKVGRKKEGMALIDGLKKKLSELQPPSKRYRVVYEVTQLPYNIAGQKNIVTDIITFAGGEQIVDAKRKFVKTSAETVLVLNPDVYIFQKGPMNKNPKHPGKRPEFSKLKAKYLMVDELSFSRANTNSFENVIKLNKFFHKLD